MKKTLLIAAATLAVGVITTQAAVYSQNVVGYINVNLPGNNNFQFIANQLQTVSVLGTNDIQDVFASSTLVSDPNGVTNTVLQWWNGAGYTPYQYYSAADSGGSAGFYDVQGNYAVGVKLKQSSASFIVNPGSAASTLTFVGNVVQGTNLIPVGVGFNALSIVPPVSTNITSMGFVGLSDPNGINNDVLFKYNNGWTPFQYYSAADSGGPAGFYDVQGNFADTNSASYPLVGQGFFIQRFQNVSSTWTNIFTAQ
jgi:hypothetical protein